MLLCVLNPKQYLCTEKKTVCALFVSKEKWKYLGRKETQNVYSS
jgi:hypothetical protein